MCVLLLLYARGGRKEAHEAWVTSRAIGMAALLGKKRFRKVRKILTGWSGDTTVTLLRCKGC